MTKIERIEKQIRDLTVEELASFRKWFTEFDAEIWDQQLESDVKAGRLEKLSEKALKDHKNGKTLPL